MEVILTKIVIIFAMAGVGFAANKGKILPDESNSYLIALLMNITAPCMLLTSIAGKELTPATFLATLQVLVGTIVFFVVGMGLSYVLVKAMKAPKADQGVYMSILTTVNTGFMGFPVSKAAFGNDGLYFMAISNIVLNIYLYSLGIIQLNMGSGKSKGLAATLKPMLNPCAIAAALGIIMLFCGLHIPSAVNEFLVSIGDITIPLSMIVVGMQLGGSNLRQVVRNGRLLAVTLMSLILWPALTFLAVNWLPLEQMAKLTLIYASAFPSAVIIAALAAQEGKNAQLAAEGVASTTLLSMGTLPVITMLLTAYFGM